LTDDGFGSEVLVSLDVAIMGRATWGGLLGNEDGYWGALADASATVGEPGANAP
jgi:hypothetical protein